MKQEQPKEKWMETKIDYLEVSTKVVECITQNYGANYKDEEVLEGIYLAMQVIAGPRQAARVISNCAAGTRQQGETS